jgi:hypothetical protein
MSEQTEKLLLMVEQIEGLYYQDQHGVHDVV